MSHCQIHVLTAREQKFNKPTIPGELATVYRILDNRIFTCTTIINYTFTAE